MVYGQMTKGVGGKYKRRRMTREYILWFVRHQVDDMMEDVEWTKENRPDRDIMELMKKQIKELFFNLVLLTTNMKMSEVREKAKYIMKEFEKNLPENYMMELSYIEKYIFIPEVCGNDSGRDLKIGTMMW